MIGVSAMIGRGDRGTSDVSAFRAQTSTAPPTSTAAGREEQALGHELLHDARGTRAKGEPHRHFVLARRAALQQQVGDVGADDEQHQRADAEHHREQRRHPITGADVEHAGGQSDVAILREARRQPGAGRLRGGARGLERGARGEAPEHGQPPHASLGEQMGTSADLRLHRHRNPEIHREMGDGAVEVGRRDAHDRHGVVADPERTADHAGVTREAPLPERVADHDDRGAALDGILAGDEAAANHRLHAEHVEVVRARQHAPYRFGDARLRHGARAQVEAADAERGQALERLRVRAGFGIARVLVVRV